MVKINSCKTMKHNPRNELNKNIGQCHIQQMLYSNGKVVNEANDKDYSKVDKPALFYFSMTTKWLILKKLKNLYLIGVEKAQ